MLMGQDHKPFGGGIEDGTPTLQGKWGFIQGYNCHLLACLPQIQAKSIITFLGF
jgi:hypothetical protein